MERSGADERRRRRGNRNVDDAGAVECAAATTKDETLDDAAANESEIERGRGQAARIRSSSKCREEERRKYSQPREQ